VVEMLLARAIPGRPVRAAIAAAARPTNRRRGWTGSVKWFMLGTMVRCERKERRAHELPIYAGNSLDVAGSSIYDGRLENNCGQFACFLANGPNPYQSA
jgi:hypothetical protein